MIDIYEICSKISRTSNIKWSPMLKHWNAALLANKIGILSKQLRAWCLMQLVPAPIATTAELRVSRSKSPQTFNTSNLVCLHEPSWPPDKNKKYSWRKKQLKLKSQNLTLEPFCTYFLKIQYICSLNIYHIYILAYETYQFKFCKNTHVYSTTKYKWTDI